MCTTETHLGCTLSKSFLPKVSEDSCHELTSTGSWSCLKSFYIKNPLNFFATWTPRTFQAVADAFNPPQKALTKIHEWHFINCFYAYVAFIRTMWKISAFAKLAKVSFAFGRLILCTYILYTYYIYIYIYLKQFCISLFNIYFMHIRAKLMQRESEYYAFTSDFPQLYIL